MALEPIKDQIDRLVRDARILGEKRVIRAESDPVTEAIRTQVIERIWAYQARAVYPDAKIAKALGIAAETLAAVFNGPFIADHVPHIRALDKWLETQIMRENAPKPGGFVLTGVAEAIYGAARWAIKMNTMAMVHGPSGIGKSITLAAIRSETPASVYVAMRAGAGTPLAVLETIGHALHLKDTRGARYWFDQLEELLKGSGRLIMIDEVHKLIGGKAGDAPLHAIRDLHDATGCPVLMCGTSDIVKHIQRGVARGNEPLDQLNSRIQCWIDLTERAAGKDGKGGRPLATEKDIRAMFATSKMRMTPDAIGYLKWLANEPGSGAYRACAALVALAIELFQGEADAITSDHLRQVQQLRLGGAAAQRLEERFAEQPPQRAMLKMG